MRILIAAVAAATLVRISAADAPKARFTRGPLVSSVQNETDAAIDRAVAWLVDHQSPEGFWGPTNVKTTAVCAIAVRGDRSEYSQAETNCLRKALSWLRSQPSTNSWRNVAVPFLDGKFDGDMSGLFADFARDLPDANDVVAAFVTAASADVKKADSRDLARKWGGETTARWIDDPERCWWLAHSINAGSGGELRSYADSGELLRTVNWRGDVARRWVLSQRVDLKGGGHWDASAEKTAFAILLLCEL